MINSHLRDAYACCQFFAELEDDIVNNGNSKGWTELDVSARILEIRLEQDLCVGPSFGTIAGSGSNGAVIHYFPTEETNSPVNDSAVLLLDSGGLYADGGTTDITRTFFFGPEPPPEVVDSYTRFSQNASYITGCNRRSIEKKTRVLMGAIDVARAVFPDGTLDTAVDIAARQHLFAAGMDYG